MKHPLSLLFFIFSTCGGLSVSASPELACEEPIYSFGNVKGEPKIDHEFRLKNEGTSTLNIHRIRTSCGCTTPGISSLEIPAGEEVILPVSMNLKGRTGKQTQRITLSTNDPDNQTFILTMRGEVTPPVTISPRILNMGFIDPKDPPAQTVTLHSTEGQPFKITRAESNKGWVNIIQEPNADQTEYTLYIAPVPGKKQGVFSDVVMIDTDVKNVTDKQVVVMWRVQTGITVTPSKLTLITSSTPRPLQKILKIESPPELAEDLVIKSATWPGREDITIQIRSSEHGWRLFVRDVLPVSSMNGEHILIQTNNPETPELKVPVRILKRN